jgi:hypothetical protein
MTDKELKKLVEKEKLIKANGGSGDVTIKYQDNRIIHMDLLLKDDMKS